MSDFTSFLERKHQLLETVARLIEIVEAELNSQDIEKLHHFKKGLIEDLTFKMLCIGDFSSGKSTFINRFLLQQDILPAFPKPTTTRPTKIRYGESLKAQLFFQNGSKEEVFENVAERLLETVSTGGRDVEQVSHVILESPSTILQDGIELVDAPGLNDPDAERMKITFDYLHQADAILFFLNAQQPWTRYQKTFFEKNLLEREDINKLFIVANYWDQIESSEREDVLAYLEEQLQASLRQQYNNGNDKKSIDLHILPVSSKTGENGEAVKQSIWNYLGNRKFSDVLASKVQRLNSYIDSYTKHLDEQITLVKLDRSSKEKKRTALEREIESYKKQRDQFVLDLKQFLKPDFEDYRKTVEDLFDNLSSKMREMMLQLKRENLTVTDINTKLSIRLSRLQDEQTREMQLKEAIFLERIKAIIEEQKGMIEVPSNSAIHINDYYLKWDRLSKFDSLQTAAIASGALGVAGLLVGAGTLLQTLSAPVTSLGIFSTVGSTLFGSTTAVSSTMAFGLPGIVVGTMAIASSIYLKHRSSQENMRQLDDLTDQLEYTISQEKLKIISNMAKNQTQNIEAICKEVDHEINQTYRQKLEELDRIDSIMDQGAHFQSLYKLISTMRMKVNP